MNIITSMLCSVYTTIAGEYCDPGFCTPIGIIVASTATPLGKSLIITQTKKKKTKYIYIYIYTVDGIYFANTSKTNKFDENHKIIDKYIKVVNLEILKVKTWFGDKDLFS